MTILNNVVTRLGPHISTLMLLAGPLLAELAYAQQAAINPLIPEDIFELEYARDPQVSPDGTTIAYVRHSMDIMSDKARKGIWLTDASGDFHRPLLSSRANYSSPRWSPSGDRVAYLSNTEGSQQIYVKWLASGDTALVSNVAKHRHILPGHLMAVGWLSLCLFPTA